MRVARWLLGALAFGVLVGFAGGFLGSLMTPRRRLPAGLRQPDPAPRSDT